MARKIRCNWTDDRYVFIDHKRYYRKTRCSETAAAQFETNPRLYPPTPSDPTQTRVYCEDHAEAMRRNAGWVEKVAV